MYSMEHIRSELDRLNIKYDILDPERFLRVYFLNGEYTKLEITESGDVCVGGKIRDFDEIISRSY